MSQYFSVVLRTLRTGQNRSKLVVVGDFDRTWGVMFLLSPPQAVGVSDMIFREIAEDERAGLQDQTGILDLSGATVFNIGYLDRGQDGTNMRIYLKLTGDRHFAIPEGDISITLQEARDDIGW